MKRSLRHSSELVICAATLASSTQLKKRKTRNNLEMNMTSEQLQTAIEFCVTALATKELPTYVRASLEPHLTALLFQQAARSKAAA
jgi:hypothetical protein